MGAEVELDGVIVELGGHLEVIANLLGEAGLEVALGQALKEMAEWRHAGRQGTMERRRLSRVGIDGGMVANLVDRAVHEVGGGHVKLPEVLGLPGSEGIGVTALMSAKVISVSIFSIWGLPIFSANPRTFSWSKMSRRRALDISRWRRDEIDDGLALFGVDSRRASRASANSMLGATCSTLRRALPVS